MITFKKINIVEKENRQMISQFEDSILNLIDNQDEFTRSDLQGAVTAIVFNILRVKLNK